MSDIGIYIYRYLYIYKEKVKRDKTMILSTLKVYSSIDYL